MRGVVEMPNNVVSSALWILGVAVGGWLVVTAATTAALEGSGAIAAGLILAALLTYWYLNERKETDSAAETAQRVGDQASGLFGGVVDWFSAVVISSLFVGLTVGGQFLDVIDIALQMLYTAPVVSSILGAGGALAALDALGSISLSAREWTAAVVGLIVLGVLGRRTLYGEVE